MQTQHKTKTVFITGGTGYIGVRLIRQLRGRGHKVIALVRKNSEHKLPAGTDYVVGDPFDAATFVQHIPPGSTFIQLLGVPHPGPKKRDLFYQIDLSSAKTSADAATTAGVAHFIYVSVVQEPSGIMRDYQQVRAEAEQYILSKKLNCTFIRPWYVLGPGHRWPVLLFPLYAILKLHPRTRRKAEVFGLVKLSQMLKALVATVEEPGNFSSVLEVGDIRKF